MKHFDYIKEHFLEILGLSLITLTTLLLTFALVPHILEVWSSTLHSEMNRWGLL